MAGPRAEKVAAVEEVKDHLERTDAAILTEYRGLKVGDLATLRRSLRAAGAEYKIYKNTLVRRATAETGMVAIDPLLEGPTAIAFVEGDVATVAKVLRDFARTNPSLVVKGGLIGSSLIDARSAAALADLPSRDALLAQIAGAFAAPLRQFAGLLKALPQNLAYGLSAVIDQKRAAGDSSGEPGAGAGVASVPEPGSGETDSGTGASAAPTATEAPGAAGADTAPSAAGEAAETPAADEGDAAAPESSGAEADLPAEDADATGGTAPDESE